MAVFDLVYLTLCTVFYSLELLYRGFTDSEDWLYGWVFASQVVVFPLECVASAGSVYTTVALTLDRTVAVAFPLKWKSVCTSRRVKTVLVAVIAWSVLSNIPSMMEEYIGRVWLTHNHSYIGAHTTQYGESPFNIEIKIQILEPVFQYSFPCLLICTANCVIAVVLRRGPALRRRRHVGKITLEVVVISMVTLVSQGLHCTTAVILASYNTIYVEESPVFVGILDLVAHLLSVINSTINFFVYCYFGEKFRRAFFRRFRK